MYKVELGDWCISRVRGLAKRRWLRENHLGVLQQKDDRGIAR